jgi:hypothetical protein
MFLDHANESYEERKNNFIQDSVKNHINNLQDNCNSPVKNREIKMN